MLAGAGIYLTIFGFTMFYWRWDFLMQTVEPYLVIALGFWCGWEAFQAYSTLGRASRQIPAS